MQMINDQNDAFNELIENFDKKLQAVLERQEEEYLKGYSVYVQQRERELKEYIKKLNDRQHNNDFKDEILQGLRKQIADSHKLNIVLQEQIGTLTKKLSKKELLL